MPFADKEIRASCPLRAAYWEEIMEKKEKNYLEYLAELYPTIAGASTEIINLQSIINLPKGT